MSTVVYLFIAVLVLALGLWKITALLRDPTPALALIASNFLVASAVYVMAAPLVYRKVGEAFDRPSFATLPVYVGILACFAHLHLLTLVWDPDLRQPPVRLHRTFAAWTLTYLLTSAAMTVLFCSADLSGPGDGDPLTFNTDHAGDPLVLLFLALFLATLATGSLSTYRRCRNLQPDDPRIEHALAWFARGSLLVVGYVLCNAPAIAVAATGSHALDRIGVLGSTAGASGALVASYGLSGAAVSAWRRERRDIKKLRPLWNLVVRDVNASLALSAHSARSHRRLLNRQYLLTRRIIEIHDGMQALGPWISPLTADALDRLQAARLEQLSESELTAVATAAALRDATDLLRSARAKQATDAPVPPPGAAPLPGRRTRAVDERQRLLLVSGALDHPLTKDVLAETHALRKGGISSPGHPSG
ncbi:MAB_1171c family putative transporter [Streptomyces sp. TLI_146]|uniref:MAB_1171c family putative transporter n=1 Tax=Streptomyces sp. TLI_146 TaxID=1938858 RepID=UPI000C70A263|nr:MAB_1171c family putative transporter [Streptomyces sp. TLI_146]